MQQKTSIENSLEKRHKNILFSLSSSLSFMYLYLHQSYQPMNQPTNQPICAKLWRYKNILDEPLHSNQGHSMFYDPTGKF